MQFDPSEAGDVLVLDDGTCATAAARMWTAS